MARPALDALSVCLEASFKIGTLSELTLTWKELVVDHLATVIHCEGLG